MCKYVPRVSISRCLAGPAGLRHARDMVGPGLPRLRVSQPAPGGPQDGPSAGKEPHGSRPGTPPQGPAARRQGRVVGRWSQGGRLQGWGSTRGLVVSVHTPVCVMEHNPRAHTRDLEMSGHLLLDCWSIRWEKCGTSQVGRLPLGVAGPVCPFCTCLPLQMGQLGSADRPQTLEQKRRFTEHPCPVFTK